MSRSVEFSFKTDEDKREFEEMASRRGQTLSQFAKWCIYKYKRDRTANTESVRARRLRGRETGIGA